MGISINSYIEANNKLKTQHTLGYVRLLILQFNVEKWINIYSHVIKHCKFNKNKTIKWTVHYPI